MNEDDTSMSCELVWGWLEHDLDGTLAPPDRTLLRAHLRSCPACAALADDASVVRALMAQRSRPVCPERVVERVLARIDAGDVDEILTRRAVAPRAQRRGDGFRQRFPRTLPLPGWARTAVALAAAAALVLLLTPLARRAPSQQIAQSQRPAPNGAITAQQAQQAEQQLRLAFTVLGQTLDHTSALAGQTVRSSVTDPLLRALEPRGSQETPNSERRTGSISGPEMLDETC